MTATVDSTIADLQRANAELRRQLYVRTSERDEALAQQIATAEVLGVINSSPGDLVPVFDAMLERATRLCEAASGALYVPNGDLARIVASLGITGPLLEYLIHEPLRLTTLLGTAFTDRTVLHIADLAAEEAYHRRVPSTVAAVELGGVRSILLVPLLKDGTFVGAFAIFRQEVRPFSDKQIALLQNFAAQAVIAIENARLLGELRQRTGELAQSVEELKALSEIGQAVSSTVDLRTVLATVLNRSLGLTGADAGAIFRYCEAERSFGLVEAVGWGDALVRSVTEMRIGEGETGMGQAVASGAPLQLADLAERPSFPLRDAALAAGFHGVLIVPLVGAEQVLGTLVLQRREAGEFPVETVRLMRTLASQSALAIQNAGLFDELRERTGDLQEALEFETATAEVLQVINSSAGELTPVFDAISDKATRLANAAFGGIGIWEGDRYEVVSVRGLSPRFADFLSRNQVSPGPRSGFARVAREQGHVHFADLAASKFYQSGEPLTRAIVDLGLARSTLTVPLVKDDAVIGILTVYRQEVRPFSNKQIAFSKSFAAQAMLAIEHARLVGELRARSEELERERDAAERARADMRALLDNLSDGALLVEAGGTLGLRNKAIFEINGWPADVFADIDLSGALRWQLENGHVQRQCTAIDEDVALQWTRFETADGMPVIDRRPNGNWLEARWIALPDGRRLLMHRDVTELKEREEALARSEGRLVDALEAIPHGLVLFDAEDRLVLANSRFREYYPSIADITTPGVPVQDMLLMAARQGLVPTWDMTIEDWLEHRMAMRRNPGPPVETKLSSGKWVQIYERRTREGGLAGIYSDISHLKEQEERLAHERDSAEAALLELKVAQANLIHAEKMASLGQLTAGIAHEIKNPLNFVNNFASLSVELLEELKETTEPAVATLDAEKRAEIGDTLKKLTGNLERIAEHGKRADNIVKSMLEHSRGVSGERREVDLNGLIDEALNLAYHGARAQDRGFNITLERTFDPALAQIELAPQEMTRVFLNLFGNGFYAVNKRVRENGGGSFRPTLTVATRDLGDTVEVRVRDNGNGIPPDIKDKLFQPFFTTKPTGEGTGLGLSISYDIVTQQHGGTIEVESEVGAHTEFTIRLPRH